MAACPPHLPVSARGFLPPPHLSRGRGVYEQVGVILLAGGQGTRLGFSKPKGMYNVGFPGGDTLFALQAAQIDRLRVLAAAAAGVPVETVKLPWYVMTSPQVCVDGGSPCRVVPLVVVADGAC